MRCLFQIHLFIFFSIFIFSQNYQPAQKSNALQNYFHEPRFEHISLKDGLPEKSVSSILQDHLGYLWLGTQNGLVKYDGYSMTVYQPDSDNPNSLCQRMVRKIYEDKSGTLWLLTGTFANRSLSRFDRETNSFTCFNNNPDDSSSISSDIVNCIYEDNKGRLWIGTDKGLNLLDRKNNKFKKIIFQEYSDNSETRESSSNTNLSDVGIFAIDEDFSTGNLFLGIENPGLWIFDADKNTIHRQEMSVEENVISNGIILDFDQSPNGLLWIASSHGLANYDPIEKELKSYQIVPSIESIPENDFLELIQDQDGLIWARHSAFSTLGLVCFDPRLEKFQTYRNISKDPTSLSGNRIWSLYEDKTGILWVGTWTYGLNKWNKHKWKFNSFQQDPQNPNSLSNNSTAAISEDTDGFIWFGTEGGLDRLDKTTERFTHYLHDPQNDKSVSSNRISSIFHDPINPGITWVGTWFNGLNKYDSRHNNFSRVLTDSKEFSKPGDNQVYTIFLDSERYLWIGTASGVHYIKQSTGEIKHFRYDPGDPESLRLGVARSIYEDRAGKIWVGTNQGGLNLFDRKDNKFISYKSFSKGVEHASVTSICEDKNGNFWVGTYTNGLYLFDRNRGIAIKNYTRNDGLPQNSIGAILEDDSGNLWISTENGLTKFSPSTGVFKNYDITDGLLSDIFRIGSGFKASNGKMYFGATAGVTAFHPDSIRDDPVPPQVVLTDLSLFNRPGEKLNFKGFISELNELELSYNQNDLRFNYVGLHFGEPGENIFKYILENFDDDWVDAGKQRNATYTNLEPGKYVFRVKSANRDGVWNEAGTSILIIITPPWWETWWAYSLYFFIIVSVLFNVRRYELNRVQWKNQVQLDEVMLKEREESDKMKSRFFANISHEFRTPLTLILGPVEKIKSIYPGDEIHKQTVLIKKNANRLLSLVNQLLDLSKLEAGKLKLCAEQTDIVSFAKGILMSFESIAELNDISLNVRSSNEIIQLFFDRDKMAKILTNLLSNAFKFTRQDGEVHVCIEAESESVIIKVGDTGTGIAEDELPKLFDRFYQVDSSQTREHEGSGIGLALTKELVELHHGKISVSSNKEDLSNEKHGWTEFTIELPLGRNHLNDDSIKEEKTNEDQSLIKSEYAIDNLAEMVSETDNEVNPPSIDSNYSNMNKSQPNHEGDDKFIILVVEDNTDVREYIKDSLGHDFQIEEAVNGEQGVSRAKKIIPDLIISDVMMPVMDGNKLSIILKKDEITSHVPIILLTAKSELESKIEGLETGADDYITKPFDTRELRVRIKNLIDIRKNLQKKFGGAEFAPEVKKNKFGNIEELFMCKVMEVINNHISEEEFSIEQFAQELDMSRMQLHRKLKALTGKSASLYIRSFRLNRAKKMIEDKKGNVSEIAYDVGFSSPAYFTRCFKEEFGIPPTELIS